MKKTKGQKNAAKCLRYIERNGCPIKLRTGTYGNCNADGTVGVGCALTAIVAILEPKSIRASSLSEGNDIDHRKLHAAARRLLGVRGERGVIEAFDAEYDMSVDEKDDSAWEYARLKSPMKRLKLILKKISATGKAFAHA